MEDLAPHLLSEAGKIGFELDRFELVDGRLELTGRWFGVQGRRFMRPSLTLRADEGQTRLLADLAHKPWAAEHGELWQATFPCDGELDARDHAELTVAPDVTIELRVPDAARARLDMPKRDAQTRREPRRENGMHDAERRPSPAVRPASVAQRRAETDQIRALSSARAEIATLRERLETVGPEQERERTRLAEDLRESQEATADAVRGRDEAIAAGREVTESRERAQQTIDQALAARGRAKRATEHALAQRDGAVARLEQALAERDGGLAQRDRAARELERVVRERDELARANAQLRHQHETAAATRGSPLEMRNSAIDSLTERRQVHRLTVAIAVTSLLAVSLALILILSSN